VARRIDRVLEGLGLQRSHPHLVTITDLLRRGAQVRDAGECPCGGATLCGFIDLGAVDWYSNFFHVCPECLRHRHQEEYTGTSQETGAEVLCPWCQPLWFW